MLRNVEKRGVQAARNGPSEDRKCWQRIELGIHGLKRGNAEFKAAFKVTKAEGAIHFRAPGKRGLPPPSPWPLFPRLLPHAPRRDQRGQAVRRPSRWLLHATNHRIGNDRTGPDLDERVVYIIQRADKELKAPPALEGSAMVARPTRPQIFAVN